MVVEFRVAPFIVTSLTQGEQSNTDRFYLAIPHPSTIGHQVGCMVDFL
jgi:hypothetical protein